MPFAAGEGAIKVNETKVSVNTSRQQGLTLIELMVTLAVATILVGIAVPSFKSIQVNNRLAAQTNEMSGSFALARSEAIKRGSVVRVVAADSDDWGKGWTIRADANRDGDFTDPGDVIYSQAPFRDSVVEPAADNNLTIPGVVEFNSRGALAPTGDVFSVKISDPECKGDQVRTFTVSVVGRASVVRSSCS